MDIIKIRNLEIFSNHGVLKEENVLGQKFLVSADIFLDTGKAGKTDDLSYSVNYAEICHTMKHIMESNTFRLIETAAEKLCEAVLLEYPPVRKIRLEVKKPWAPILLPLDHVSVCVERQWHRVYLSMGSNMGDREKFLNDAVEFFRQDRNIKNIRVSDFIETEPYGNTDQDSFINCCAELETLYTPHELHAVTSQAEQNAKRERLVHWGPRTLDVDLVLYDEIMFHDDELTIPHADMANREFVLAPLVQLNPYAVNPALNKTAAVLLAELKKS